MMAEKSIRMLLVDDHPLIRGGIAFALRDEIDIAIVGEAENGQEAIEAFRKYNPDITLMDLQMQGMSGIQAMAAIRDEAPDAKIVILTTYSGDIQASLSFKNGASGYFLKGTPQADLINVIRTAHGGLKHVPSSVATALAEHMASRYLTPRELEVLRAVGAGCSNRGVADLLGLSEETVKGHIKNIF